jgi:hypothetical protein
MTQGLYLKSRKSLTRGGPLDLSPRHHRPRIAHASGTHRPRIAHASGTHRPRIAHASPTRRPRVESASPFSRGSTPDLCKILTTHATDTRSQNRRYQNPPRSARQHLGSEPWSGDLAQLSSTSPWSNSAWPPLAARARCGRGRTAVTHASL